MKVVKAVGRGLAEIRSLREEAEGTIVSFANRRKVQSCCITPQQSDIRRFEVGGCVVMAVNRLAFAAHAALAARNDDEVSPHTHTRLRPPVRATCEWVEESMRMRDCCVSIRPRCSAVK